MVASWLPDPPMGRSSDEISTLSAPVVFVDSDTDDEESNAGNENTLENGGYQLLNGMNFPDPDESHEESEDGSSNVSSESAQEMPSDSNSDCTDSNSSVLVPESTQSDNAETRDINVDYEQVRAVMAHVTLPASATPSWATAIPDSEWCTFLQDRIRTLQGRNELDPESEN